MSVAKDTVLSTMKRYNDKLQEDLKETYATKAEVDSSVKIAIGPTQPTSRSLWLDTSRYERGEGS